MTTVVCIAPHPDDEALGCGGTLAMFAADPSNHVSVIYLTDCGDLRANESYGSCRALGINPARRYFLNEKDGELRSDLTVAGRIKAIFQTIGTAAGPLIVLAPNFHEAHSDHRAAGALALEAVRDLTASLWLYEVWTPLQTIVYSIDITPYVGQKMTAIRSYASQFRGNFDNKLDEGILSLNRYRGASSTSRETVLYREVFG